MSGFQEISELEYRKIGTFLSGVCATGFSCVCAGTRRAAIEPFRSSIQLPSESFSLYGRIVAWKNDGRFYVLDDEFAALEEDGFDMRSQAVADWWD
jgi:hypothetical protein